METLAYLYFTESYEESDPASTLKQHQDQPSNPDPTSSIIPTSSTGDQPAPMQLTGYDPKLDAQPNWMM